MWCLGAELFGKELVATDGSKFKAVNIPTRNVTHGKLAQKIEREKESVKKYLAELEETDAQDEGEEKRLSAEELKEKIATIGESLKQHEELLTEMKENGEKQRSLSDPDARLMKTAKGSDVSYNIQPAVDSKHKLKVGIGHDGLIMKGLRNVGTEIKLRVLNFNFKRVMSILGIEKMIELLKHEKLMPQPI